MLIRTNGLSKWLNKKMLGLFNSVSSGIYVVVGILLILYVYLWLHDTDMAMNVTTAIFKVFYGLVKGIIMIIVKIVTWIVELFSKLLK